MEKERKKSNEVIALSVCHRVAAVIIVDFDHLGS